MSAEPAGEAENKYCLSPDSDPGAVGTSLFILMKRNSIFRPAKGGITFLEFIPPYWNLFQGGTKQSKTKK